MTYYKVQGDISVRVKRLGCNIIPMALSLAHKFSNHQHVELEDIISAALLGLVKASNEFNIKMNSRPSTYAYKRISGEILDLLRKEGVYKKRYQLADDELLSTIYKDAEVEQTIAERELIQTLRSIVVNELSTEFKNIVYVAYWKNMTDQEASKVLSCCVATYRKRKVEALTALKYAFSKRGIKCR